MKTYYRLTKNGIQFGDYEDLSGAFDRAEKLERDRLTWKTTDCASHYAFGKTMNGLRSEYEIEPVRKRG